MCNIVSLKCQHCKRPIDTHIEDFSVPGESVKAWCHNCKDWSTKYLWQFDKQVIVFIDQGCCFIVELPRGISLNGERKEAVDKSPKRKIKN